MACGSWNSGDIPARRWSQATAGDTAGRKEGFFLLPFLSCAWPVPPCSQSQTKARGAGAWEAQPGRCSLGGAAWTRQTPCSKSRAGEGRGSTEITASGPAHAQRRELVQRGRKKNNNLGGYGIVILFIYLFILSFIQFGWGGVREVFAFRFLPPPPSAGPEGHVTLQDLIYPSRQVNECNGRKWGREKWQHARGLGMASFESPQTATVPDPSETHPVPQPLK